MNDTSRVRDAVAEAIFSTLCPKMSPEHAAAEVINAFNALRRAREAHVRELRLDRPHIGPGMSRQADALILSEMARATACDAVATAVINAVARV